MTDLSREMKELDYGMAMSIQAMILALGMFSENQQRLRRGESIAYTEKQFNSLIDDLGVHHNKVIQRWNDMQE